MAYRNGTYIAFHADGTNQPSKSDIDYYYMMRAWTVNPDDDFTMINSHEKTSAVRDTSKKETLRARLLERLRNSKNMVLIIGETTKNDTDWIPFEIEQAIDRFRIPIIAAYTDYQRFLAPGELCPLWPTALARRIDNKTAHVIHIPFKKAPLMAAISQFDCNNYPKNGGLGYYSREAYQQWGLL